MIENKNKNGKIRVKEAVIYIHCNHDFDIPDFLSKKGFDVDIEIIENADKDSIIGIRVFHNIESKFNI